ncbi:MAG: corrinoid protein [Phycisphaerales bacterium]|nr:corrinoid protein [Phycisphaerales bacterium]
MSLLEKIAKAVLDGDEDAVPGLVRQAVQEGSAPNDVLQQGLLKGMAEVGRLFRDGEYFVPEVLISAETLKAGTAVLKPLLVAAGIKPEFTAIVGTVKGDLHDIGKNLVSTMLEGVGFEVIDIGVDVPAERFVSACREHKAHIVAISALLTTTMPAMEEAVKALRAANLQPTPMVLVGGAPITQDYADKIGANGYGKDAATGAELARKLVSR